MPVTGLTQNDFEVREDGVVQRVQLFQAVTLSGQPPEGSDESLAIRSSDHARQEAGRDDVRLLVIFIDDYHLKYGAIADTRLRNDLVRFIQGAMRPLDLLAVMGPLTPMSDLGLTRDKSRLFDRVNQVQGRLGGFVPPRSPIEEAHMQLGAGDLTRIRAQVSLSALESLAVHLGGLREGRKSILYVSQGPPMRAGGLEMFSALREVIIAANRNNVTIHTLDPRQLGEARLVSDANTALSSDTGGRRIGLTNDFSRPLQGVMADASSYYLLGYESQATTADGKFRKIDVDVKRGGVRVIARNGYWAPRPEELRTAATAAAASIVSPEVAEALDSLKDQARRTAVTQWIGLRSLDSGQSEVTVVLESLAARDTPKVGTIQLADHAARRCLDTVPSGRRAARRLAAAIGGAARAPAHTDKRQKRRRRGSGQLGARHRGPATGRQRSGGHPGRLPARQRPAIPRADGGDRGPTGRHPPFQAHRSRDCPARDGSAFAGAGGRAAAESSGRPAANDVDHHSADRW